MSRPKHQVGVAPPPANHGRGLIPTCKAALTGPAPSVDLAGIYPGVRLLDVDRDGRPEVIVTFSTATGMGDITWVMKWDGRTLKPMGQPTNDPVFVDYFADGQLGMVAPDVESKLDENNLPSELALYRLVGGSYAKAGNLSAFETFRRGDGAPVEEEREFSVSNPGGNYTLTVVNGTSSGNMVSSAEVKLNGVGVLMPDAFSQAKKVIKVPVAVGSRNTLSVKLAGAPGSVIIIGVSTQ